MRDGTILRADVYRPAVSGRFPVLVRRTPYDKRRWSDQAFRIAQAGYIVVVQDMRGRHTSDGDFVWAWGDHRATPDAEDGFDTIEWAATLDGSDGKVGTWGHSYDGWASWMLAPLQPPHLRSIFATGSSPDVLDLTFGVFETGRRLEWVYMMAADVRRRAGGTDGPTTWWEATDEFHTVIRGKWTWFTPLEDIPEYVFSGLTGQYQKYLRETNLELYNHGSYHPRINVPAMMVTGWWDRLVHTIDHFTGLRSNGPEHLRDQHRIVIGPWGHDHQNFLGRFGPLDHGRDANAMYEDLVVRWADCQLKGIDNGISSEPPIRLFVLGENRWRFEDRWPLERAESRPLYLHSGGGANTVRGDGRLSWDPPADEPPDRYDFDPVDPLMSLMTPDSQSAPQDQRPLDGRRDKLVYMTEPLESPLEVTGPIELVLWAETDAPDTDWAVKLIDVHPNGLAVNLSYGYMRASYREGYAEPKLLEPGRPYEYRVKMGPTSMVFQPGHRIRLDIGSSDFPNFDRNHNTGRDFWSDREFRVARQAIYHSDEMTSYLVMPVIEG
jgi:uncharacterized protein